MPRDLRAKPDDAVDLAWPIISDGDGLFTVLEPDGSIYDEGLTWEQAYRIAVTHGAPCEYCQDGHVYNRVRAGHERDGSYTCDACGGSGKAADDVDVVGPVMAEVP